MKDPDFIARYDQTEPSRFSPEEIRRQSRRDRTLAVLLGILSTYMLHPPFREVINSIVGAIVDFVLSTNLFRS